METIHEKRRLGRERLPASEYLRRRPTAESGFTRSLEPMAGDGRPCGAPHARKALSETGSIQPGQVPHAVGDPGSVQQTPTGHL